MLSGLADVVRSTNHLFRSTNSGNADECGDAFLCQIRCTFDKVGLVAMNRRGEQSSTEALALSLTVVGWHILSVGVFTY